METLFYLPFISFFYRILKVQSIADVWNTSTLFDRHGNVLDLHFQTVAICPS
jgi:hypothetical protein